MTPKEALDKIKNGYDAFFISNKCPSEKYPGTHDEEFKVIFGIATTDLDKRALAWIQNEYDCYYKNDDDYTGPDSAIAYLYKRIEELSNETK